jgi:alpha-glucosidase
VIPVQPLVQSTAETPKGALELRVYPGPGCAGSVYQDDGTSFAYRQGVFLRQSFTCGAAPDDVTLKFGAREGSFQPWWKTIDAVIYGWHSPSAVVTLNGAAISGAKYDAAQGVLRIPLPDQAKASELHVRSK